jgi:hypothetical protein
MERERFVVDYGYSMAETLFEIRVVDRVGEDGEIIMRD